MVDEDDLSNDLGYMEVQNVEQHTSFMEDQDLKAYGIELLKPRYEKIKKQLSSKNNKIPTTRIVQDVWHALKCISTPKRHSLQVEFERELTDPVMLLDQSDLVAVTKVLESQGKKISYGLYQLFLLC